MRTLTHPGALVLGFAILLCMDRSGHAIATRLSAGKPALPPFAYSRFCSAYPAECRPDSGDKAASADGHKVFTLTPRRRIELEQVNVAVNRSIAPKRHQEALAHERWEITPRIGDCNDYVVTKRHELLQKGWPSSALLMTEVVLHSGEHHLVLVARTNEGDLVLDNLSNALRTVAAATNEYHWVRMESPQNPNFWQKVQQPG